MFGLGRHSPWLGLENERGERGWTWNINYPGDSPAAPPPLPASPKVPGMDGRINMHSPVDQRAPTRIPTESCTHLCAQPLHPLAWAHRDRKTERWENPLGCDKESMNSLPIEGPCSTHSARGSAPPETFWRWLWWGMGSSPCLTPGPAWKMRGRLLSSPFPSAPAMHPAGTLQGEKDALY